MDAGRLRNDQIDAVTGGSYLFRNTVLTLVVLMTGAAAAQAAQLSSDARTAIPHDVQQLVVID
jgi:hypothetical protein